VCGCFTSVCFIRDAPLCNSLRNDVASMEPYSSWVNCTKEKCISADLMHLFLVRFVTVRLTYIFIDYPDCEYIIILNTSIVIYDLWRLSVLLSSTPYLEIAIAKRLVCWQIREWYTRTCLPSIWYLCSRIKKKRKMYTSSVADKWYWQLRGQP
jgi:hypothetical protein